MKTLIICGLLIAVTYAKPATIKSEKDTNTINNSQDDSEALLVTPLEDNAEKVPNEDMALVPVGVVAEKIDDGEDMETANARYYPDYYYFRPVYSYRRVQSNRRRVYSPRKRYSNYDSGDRFPTVT